MKTLLIATLTTVVLAMGGCSQANAKQTTQDEKNIQKGYVAIDRAGFNKLYTKYKRSPVGLGDMPEYVKSSGNLYYYVAGAWLDKTYTKTCDSYLVYNASTGKVHGELSEACGIPLK